MRPLTIFFDLVTKIAGQETRQPVPDTTMVGSTVSKL